MSIKHILEKEFDSDRDREWHVHIWNCESLRKFLSDYYYVNRIYYDTWFNEQRDIGIYNKLDFLISRYLSHGLCTDDILKSLISTKLQERLQ